MGQEYSDVAQVQPPRAVQVEVNASDATPEHITWKERMLQDFAEALGYTELAGVRYPVKAYQFRVSVGLTRGSRLTEADIKDLASRGYKGVVNLCAEYDDTAAVKAAGMTPLHLKIIDNVAPPQADMIQFLDFVSRVENQPAYVHCEAGKGRTGVTVATYRMAIMLFTADQAIDDGKKFGLELVDQIAFIKQFYADLQAGKLAGYPKPQGWPGSAPTDGDIAGHADNPSDANAPENYVSRADNDDASASDSSQPPEPADTSDGADDDQPDQQTQQDDPPPPASSDDSP